MKIITRAVFQMTPAGFELLEQECYEHDGDVARAKGGSAPAAPDPAISTNAEAAANRVNTVGPGGSSIYQQGDRQIIGYDSNGQPQYGNNYTQVNTLAPSEQRQYDLRNLIGEQLLGSANTQIPGFANDPFSYDSAVPETAKAQYQKNIELLGPQFDRADRSFEQRLANQGLPIGSEAYNEALQAHEGNKNQALTGLAYDTITQGNDLALRERNQRYNELAAALGSSQVQTPGGQAASPIDVSGAYDQQYQGQLADYNARQARQQGNTQALAGLASTAGLLTFMF